MRDDSGMKRAGCVVALATVGMLMVSVGESRAEETFDAVAGKATPVTGLWGLSSLLWAQLGRCDGLANELDKRQCDGIRDARVDQIAGQSFLVTTGGQPVVIGAWDAQLKAAPVEVAPCLACDAAVDIDGEKLFVVGQGDVALTGGAIRVAPLHKKSFAFKDEAALEEWKAQVMPRLTSEFVVRVDRAARWNKDGTAGMRVDVVAWRVFDPCTGKIIAAKPASADLAADKRACGDQVEEEPKQPETPTKVEPERPVKKEPVLPRQLSPYQINQGMAPVRKQSMKCFDAYGVPGKASFKVTISNEGAVSGLEQTGDFVDTPTGACLEKAIKAATFPKMKKPSMTFDFPVVLQ